MFLGDNLKMAFLLLKDVAHMNGNLFYLLTFSVQIIWYV